LRSPWALEMHTMWVPCFTSSTYLGTKIPHFRFFLFCVRKLVYIVSLILLLLTWMHEWMIKWQSANLSNYLKLWIPSS
jgi:hypothetical protein